jgi:hypothetical protein
MPRKQSRKSMKSILRSEIEKKLKNCSEIRRCSLRRCLLGDPKIVRELLQRITKDGTKAIPINTILRRIDRVFSDALDSIPYIELRHDRHKNITWIVKVDDEDEDQ